jgi:hypothetical protein
MTALRRYEILLPSQFNDGRPIPQELIAESLLELEREFGAVSCETQVIHGLWRHEGMIFRDNLARVFIDVVDTSESRQFFVGFKEILKTRFQQLDIWLTPHPIEVI